MIYPRDDQRNHMSAHREAKSRSTSSLWCTKMREFSSVRHTNFARTPSLRGSFWDHYTQICMRSSYMTPSFTGGIMLWKILLFFDLYTKPRTFPPYTVHLARTLGFPLHEALLPSVRSFLWTVPHRNQTRQGAHLPPPRCVSSTPSRV